jgi:hypothetical protein
MRDLTAHAESHDLALRLARLDVRRHELAIGQVGPGEDGVIDVIAGLYREMPDSASIRLPKHVVRTLARLMDGSPPVPKKTSKNATGHV